MVESLMARDARTGRTASWFIPAEVVARAGVTTQGHDLVGQRVDLGANSYRISRYLFAAHGYTITSLP